jgi:hypothetical protein
VVFGGGLLDGAADPVGRSEAAAATATSRTTEIRDRASVRSTDGTTNRLRRGRWCMAISPFLAKGRSLVGSSGLRPIACRSIRGLNPEIVLPAEIATNSVAHHRRQCCRTGRVDRFHRRAVRRLAAAARARARRGMCGRPPARAARQPRAGSPRGAAAADRATARRRA